MQIKCRLNADEWAEVSNATNKYIIRGLTPNKNYSIGVRKVFYRYDIYRFSWKFDYNLCCNHIKNIFFIKSSNNTGQLRIKSNNA